MIKTPDQFARPFSTLLLEQIARARAEREARVAEHERKTQAADYKQVLDVLTDVFDRPLSAFAQRTIELGKIRRGEVEDTRLRPKRGSFAEKVLNAGRKARGEPPL